MDVGYFISELLGEHGEVSVPGLGYFAHTRVNGCYNEAEGKFYPPCYSVQFNAQAIDDDSLTLHIAQRKNISLASSKYFTEKYVSGIKQQAATGEGRLADVGWFYTEQAQLVFKPNNSINSDPEFYGYPVVKLYNAGNDQASVPTPVYERETTTLEETDDAPQFATEEEHEEYLLNYAAKKRRGVVWVFVLLALLAAGAVTALLYIYDPSELGINQLTPQQTTKAIAPKKTTVRVDTLPAKDTVEDTLDIVKKPLADTSVKIEASASDSIPFPRYEIMGGAFKHKKEAETAIANYKSLGINAGIAEYVPGPRVHVTLGTFRTQAEAVKRIAELKKTKKVKQDIYPQKINAKL